jgi:ASPM-SPD-2-Hydin domain-containing protein/BACON domain-containing protein
MPSKRWSGEKMFIQQQAKVKVFGAAMILALMFVCSIAAFAAPASTWVLVATKSSLTFSGAVGSSPACQNLDVYDTTPAGPLPITMSTDASWLTVTPTTGSTEIVVSVCVKTAGLAAGTYTGHVITTQRATNSSGQGVNNSPFSVPVTLTITGSGTPAKTLTTSMSTISFSAVAGGAAPATQSLTIGENPAGALPYTVSADQTWITLSAASGTTSSAIQVGANISGLAAGNYSGHVIVSATGVTNSPMSIPVTLAVTAAQTKILTASASSLSFSAQVGTTAPATQSLTIGENPAGALPFTVSADQAWITLSAASGTTSSAIQVGAKTAGLAAGNYSGHVIVSATGVTNSPMSVTVTLAVTAASTSPYVLVATPTSLAFSGAAGSSPACQSVDVLDTTPAGPLPVAMSTDAAWLTVTPTVGQTELNISACVKTAGLAAGTFTGHVIVTMTGANSSGQTVNNSPMSIPVTLVITGAQTKTLTAAPSALAFSAVAGGAAPATQSLTIGENPAGSLPFTVSADQAWMTLSAASGTTSSAIQVGANISGLAAGNYTGHVNVSATGVTNSPMSVTVTLAVTATQTNLLTVNPTSVAFGNINLANNNTKSVTLTNSGTGSVTISQINVLGLGISVNGVAIPTTLTAGQSTVLSIVYSPTILGIVAGSVTVVSNATNSPAVILATGTGVQPQLTASPASLNFGNVAVGSSGTQTITLTNAGGAAATVSQAVASGAGYTMSGITLPMSLAAGASTSFSVQFAPTVAGSDSGSVTVTSNTPNSPTMVGMTGTGTGTVQHSVSLSWVASTTPNVVGYNIYRGTVSGGPYAVLNASPNVGLTYTDMAVTAGQTYYYVVTAVDSSGNESVVSNQAAVTVPTP